MRDLSCGITTFTTFRFVKEQSSRQGLGITHYINVHSAIFGVETGGASRDRTDDPLLAKQVLSQLSYGPL